MDTYVTKVWVDNNANNVSPIASSMFGICNSRASAITKVVTLAKFDKLVDGVTVFVKFTNGCNTANNIRLQVGSTLAYPIAGDCTCGANEVIAFTFEEVDGSTKYWHAGTAGISSAMRDYIVSLINNTVDTPDVLIFKGTIGAGGNPGILPSNGYSKGWLYYVISNGTYLDTQCEAGDFILAITDASVNQINTTSAHWAFIQHKKQKIVTGPNSATDGHIAIFDGSTGTIIADSGLTIGISVPSNAIFTDTTYSNGLGLDLNINNEFSVIYGDAADTACRGNDPRLSDARIPVSHSHGNITNDGLLGNSLTNGLVIVQDGEINIGPEFTNDGTRFLNSAGMWASIPEPPVTSVNGQTGEVIIEIPEPDLKAMHFIGIATLPIVDGGNNNPGINNYNFPTDAKPGDVILGATNQREYVYTIDSVWEMLGAPFSSIYEYEADAPNKWISKLYQNTNGEVYSVEFSALDTTGTWLGTAADAIQFTDPQQVYVNLNLNNTNTVIQGGSDEPEILGVSGILSIANGGTGTDEFEQNEVILSDNIDGQTSLTSRPYTDNNAATTLLSNSTNFITERSIYFGLPFINNLHNYDSTTEIFAPIDAGTRYALLTSNYHTVNNETVTIPEWTGAAFLQSELSINSATSYTILTLGNNIATGTIGNSAGLIYLYSSNTGYHSISGAPTTTNVNHIFPNASGILVQIPEGTNTSIGSPTQPVYINANGTVTAITYTPNRIYYSALGNDFVATTHYINDVQMSIGTSTPPNINDTLYVEGDLTLHGTTKITDDTDASSYSTGALIVSGGVGIAKKLYVQDDTILNDTLEVNGTTYLTMNTGIGQLPETGNNAHMLAVTGTTYLHGQVDIDDCLIVTDNTHATSSTGAITVTGGISINDNLYVNGTSALVDQVGIGTDSFGLDYILTINGNIAIMNEANEAATLSITETTNNNLTIESVTFMPTNDGEGYIGISTNRWKEAYFSNLIQIGDNNIELNQNGTITIQELTPTIIFNSINNNNSSIWELVNNAGILTLSNPHNNVATAILKGSDNGFNLYNRLYINTEIPTPTNNGTNLVHLFVEGSSLLNGIVGIGIDSTTSIDNNYILTVNGSIDIIYNTIDIAHMNVTINNNQQSIFTFYPVTVTQSMIGTLTDRWTYGYFSTSMQVGSLTNNNQLIGTELDGNGKITIQRTNDYAIILSTIPTNSSNIEESYVTIKSNNAMISLSTTENNNDLTADIVLTADAPSLQFNTISTNASNWILSTSVISNYGTIFSINNQAQSPIELRGTDYGFYLTNRLYINELFTAAATYSLYVTGDTCSNGNIIPTLSTGSNPIPDKTLGSINNHWAALYIGSEDTYGDPYLPIYWSNGVPTYTHGIVQKKSFILYNTDTTCTLTDSAYNQAHGIETFVIQIVITSGEQYLTGTINWESRQTPGSTSTGDIILTTTAVTGTVTGYILTARGVNLDSIT